MPHCGDSYSYGYDDDDDDDDDGSDDDADDPCYHVDDDNNVIDYTPTPSKPPTVPTTHAPTQGHTTAPSAGPTRSRRRPTIRSCTSIARTALIITTTPTTIATAT